MQGKIFLTLAMEMIYWKEHQITDSKGKNRLVGLHKTEKLHHREGYNQETERQHTEWNKVFANHTFYRGLVSKKYKDLLQLNSKKQITPIFKSTKELNRHFSKESIQIVKDYLRRCSTSLSICWMKAETKIRYHPSPVGMTII